MLFQEVPLYRAICIDHSTQSLHEAHRHVLLNRLPRVERQIIAKLLLTLAPRTLLWQVYGRHADERSSPNRQEVVYRCLAFAFEELHFEVEADGGVCEVFFDYFGVIIEAPFGVFPLGE